RGLRAAGLLDDVGQLVGDQPAAALAVRIVSAGSEVDVPAAGERDRPERGGGLVRGGVVVHPDIAEVPAERALEVDPGLRRQRAAKPGRRVDERLDTLGGGAALVGCRAFLA